MMKCYLDSNILVYWKNDESPQHKEATEILVKLRQQDVPVFLSPLVLDEFIHAIILEAKRHQSKRLFEDVFLALNDVLNIPLLSIVNPPTDPEKQKHVIGFLRQYSLRPRDAYHLLTMQTHDIDGFATFDNDFHNVFSSGILTKAR